MVPKRVDSTNQKRLLANVFFVSHITQQNIYFITDMCTSILTEVFWPTALLKLVVFSHLLFNGNGTVLLSSSCACSVFHISCLV